jgi:hypothetical protein
MPVLLVRLDVDDVAWTDLLHVDAAAGDVTDSVGDVQGLALGCVCQAVLAPGAKRTCAQPTADWSSGLRMPSM